MTRLSITHKTAYKYNKRVTLSYNEARMTPLTRVWMLVLRGYLIVAGGLVLLRSVQLSLSGH